MNRGVKWGVCSGASGGSPGEEGWGWGRGSSEEDLGEASAATHNHSVCTTAARFRSPAIYLECHRKSVRLATRRLDKQASQHKAHTAWRRASRTLANSADRILRRTSSHCRCCALGRFSFLSRPRGVGSPRTSSAGIMTECNAATATTQPVLCSTTQVIMKKWPEK